ncbi:MAG TPA: tetratricopeptide repeat protein [Gammaproteobacteria bacterium]|nr:tetratricopeptide repeat protein [Gammaproteobacteria bacterium]
MTMEKGHLLENPTRLSNSSLWQLQKNFFAHRGVEAWNQEIPFFISSNAFTGTRYAQLIVQYILDLFDPNEMATFYIVEVGAGHGKFSFYCIKALEEAINNLHIQGLQYQYIVTDVAQKNIDFCQNNEALKPLIENNRLDFAVFDMETDEDFTLVHQKVLFSSLDKIYPVLFICNYVFDVIRQDAFLIKDNALFEIAVGLHSRYPKFDPQRPIIRELKLNYAYQKIEAKDYYSEPVLKDLLSQYSELFQQKEAVILIPVGAFQFVSKMQKLCEKFLLICGDKGLATAENLADIDVSTMYTFDGCFAFSHNFHALGEYFKAQNGDYLPTQHHNDFKICLYAHNHDFTSLPKTTHFFKSILEAMGPDEFVYQNEEFAYNNYRYSLKACLSFLRSSYFEPDTYFHMHDKIMEQLPILSENFLYDVKQALRKVEENLYHYQSFYDVFPLLGFFYYQTKAYKKAEFLYKKALKYSKDPFNALRGLGLLYEARGNTNRALEYYNKALSVRSDSIIKERIRTLEGNPLIMLKPLLKMAFVFGLLAGLLYLTLFR